MKILLIGDSWGIGVFSNINGSYGPTGQGVQSLLQDHGHQIVNISKAGGSNWLMIDRLEGRWNNSTKCTFGVGTDKPIKIDLQEFDSIIFLQTDIFRERHHYGKQYEHSTDTQFKILNDDFVEDLLDYKSIEDFVDHYFQELYEKLNTFNKKILCIGGWSKLHPSIANYSNLIPVCTSASKLLIPSLKEDTYISDPEWFLQLDANQNIMSKFGTELKELAIINADKINLIINEWNDVHPPFSGYTIIAETVLPYL